MATFRGRATGGGATNTLPPSYVQKQIPTGGTYWIDPKKPDVGYLADPSKNPGAVGYPIEYINWILRPGPPTASDVRPAATGKRAREIGGQALGGKVGLAYGRVRIAPSVFFGPRVYSTDKIVVGYGLSHGPCDGLDDTIFQNGQLASAMRSSGAYADAFYSGELSPAAADAMFATAAAEQASTFERYPGLCYVRGLLTWIPELWDGMPGALPMPLFVLRGRKVRNYATGLDEWTDNPAYGLADYLTSLRYGQGAKVNASSVIDAAAYCNETFTNTAVPVGHPDRELAKHTLNYYLMRPADHKAHINALRAHFRCSVIERGGEYVFLIDKDKPPAATFNEQEAVPVSVERMGGSGIPNTVIVRAPDPANNYEIGQQYARTTGVEAGLEPPKEASYDLEGITHQTRQASEAFYLLNTRLNNLRVVLRAVHQKARKLEPNDVIEYTTASFGLAAFRLRVLRVTRSADGTAWMIECAGHDPAAYTFQSRAIETFPLPQLPNPYAEIAPPADLTLTQELRETQPGVHLPFVVANFTPRSNEAGYGGTLIEYSIDGGPFRPLPVMASGPATILIPNGPNTPVTVRAKTVNALTGATSTAVTSQTTTLTAATTPAVPAGLTLTDIGGSVLRIDWTPPAGDLFYRHTRVTLTRTVGGTAESFVLGEVAEGPLYYTVVGERASYVAKARSVNIYGTESAQAATAAVEAAGMAGPTLTITSDRQIITYDTAGAISPASQTTTFAVNKVSTNETVTWSMTNSNGTPLDAALYLSSTTGNSVSMTAENFNLARGITRGVVVKASIGGSTPLSDQISIVAVQDGQQGVPGPPGPSAIPLRIIADRSVITYDANGMVSPPTQTTQFTIQKQNTTVPATWSMTRADGTPLDQAYFLQPVSYEAEVIAANERTGEDIDAEIIALGYSGVLEWEERTFSDARILTAEKFEEARGTTRGVLVVATLTDQGVTIEDKASLLSVQDGAAGSDATAAAFALPNTATSIGGRVLVGPTTRLTQLLGTNDPTMYVEHNTLLNGDIIYLQTAVGGIKQVEFIKVTSGPTGTGPYAYSIQRNLDNTGANQWATGDVVFNTGQTGSGFLDIYADRGLKSAAEYGPTIVGNVRLSAAHDDLSTRFAVGNLRGLYGYTDTVYGAAFGVPNGPWVKIDPVNGVRMGHNASTKLVIDAAGNASFTGSITLLNQIPASGVSGLAAVATTGTLAAGNVTGLAAVATTGAYGDITGTKPPSNADVTLAAINGGLALSGGGLQLVSGGASIRGGQTAFNTGVGFWLGDASGTTKLSLGNPAGSYLTWDGATLAIKGSITLVNTIPAGSVSGLAATATNSNYSAVTGTKPPANADVTLTAITGGLSLTGGGLILASGGAAIRGGQTAYNTGTGFWLGDAEGTTKLSIGSSSGNRLLWDGANLTIVGSGTFSGIVYASGGEFSGTVYASAGSFSGTISAGSGSVGGWTIGATTLSAGSTTLDSSGVITAGNIKITPNSGVRIVGTAGVSEAFGFEYSGSVVGGMFFDGSNLGLTNGGTYLTIFTPYSINGTYFGVEISNGLTTNNVKVSGGYYIGNTLAVRERASVEPCSTTADLAAVRASLRSLLYALESHHGLITQSSSM